MPLFTDDIFVLQIFKTWGAVTVQDVVLHSFFLLVIKTPSLAFSFSLRLSPLFPFTMTPLLQKDECNAQLSVIPYNDDESTLGSEYDNDDNDDDLYRLDEYGHEIDMEDTSCSSTTDFEFILDIGLFERSRNQAAATTAAATGQTRRSYSEDDIDVLETDSLKLIQNRVPVQQRRDALRVVPTTVTPSQDLPFKQFSMLPSFIEVCEVPLGTSLRDILPSAACFPSLSSPTSFSQLARDTNRSESLLDDIDKALQILSADTM